MSKKIMLVEDDHALAQAIKARVETWGYEVFTVNDFQHVTDEFKEKSPMLVLLDINLPFFNGFYWCTEIRRLSNVPIVFISSASDNMNIVMAMNMGGDDFIAKPIDLDVLMAKLQAIFRRSYNMSVAPNVLVHPAQEERLVGDDVPFAQG